MKFLFVSLIFSIIFLVDPFRAGCQSSIRVPSERAAKRPEIAADIEGLATLKIVSRKTSYVAGEMLSVDAAIRVNQGPNYFPSLDSLTLFIKGRKGDEIKYKRFLIVDKYFSPVLLREGNIEFHSIDLIVGCREKDLSFPIGIDNVSDDEELFERGFFISKGDGCIDLKGTDTVTIQAELSNSLVALGTGDPASLKTAVGTLKSNRLTVRFNW
ncbi:MAG: hypothetical protein AB7V18_03325 [Pyrinomonadaceae bacterium]